MNKQKTQQKIQAICDNCGKAWVYTGSNKVFVTCPDCRKLVKIGGEDNDENT